MTILLYACRHCLRPSVFDACIGNSEQNDTDRFIADLKQEGIIQ